MKIKLKTFFSLPDFDEPDASLITAFQEAGFDLEDEINYFWEQHNLPDQPTIGIVADAPIPAVIEFDGGHFAAIKSRTAVLITHNGPGPYYIEPLRGPGLLKAEYVEPILS